MGVISRGIKNAFRNSIRTISVIFILGLVIAMVLVMLLAYKAVQAKIAAVKGSVGNTITVSPAGIRGFEGGGQLLTNQNATDLSSLDHVEKVIQTISDSLSNGTTPIGGPDGATSTNSTTNLTSSIEPGAFGQRREQQQREQLNSSSSTEQEPPANFSMPIQVTGTSDLSAASLGTDQFNITSGQAFDLNSSENIALVGKDLATKNNLSVDSTFQAYSQDIKVVGIFDTGNTFNNASIYLPIATVQNLSGQTGQINSLSIQVDSMDNVSSTVEAIKQKLGDSVDVTSAQEASENSIQSLENIKTISLYSLIGSLIAGAVIIFLIMMMIVRERRREIGVLKAIGSSNIKIVSQFSIEALVLTLSGSIMGIILGFVLSNPVLKILINNSASNAGPSGGGGPGAGRGMVMVQNFFGGRDALQNLHAIVNYEIILYGFLAAIVIAILGSSIPSFLSAKIRPAEVMRGE